MTGSQDSEPLKRDLSIVMDGADAQEAEQVPKVPEAEQQLPKLQEGIWGTKKVVRALNACVSADDDTELRNPWGKFYKVVCVAYWMVALGGFVAILYRDWTAETELGPPKYLSTCGAEVRNLDKCGPNGTKCFNDFASPSDWTPVRCRRFCHDDEDDKVKGGANNIYSADSNLCRAAIHAGAASVRWGGCFAFRTRGEVADLPGGERNGVESESLGWTPFTFEIKEIESTGCNTVRPWANFYAAVTFFLLVTVVRAGPRQAVMFMVFQGCIFLATFEENNDDLNSELVYALNFKSQYLYWLAPIVWFLYPFSAASTVPDSRRFPLDIMLFYWVPYWCGIRMDDMVQLGFDITLTSSMFSEPKYIIGFVILVGVAVPLTILQGRILYNAGKAKSWALYSSLFVLAAILIGLASGKYISLHIHHWFVGLVGFLFFQGQPKLRYSIVFQAAMLGSFINGVAIYGPDPFYDPAEPPESDKPPPPPVLLFSDFSATNSSIAFDWVSEQTVLNAWNCTIEGLPTQEQDDSERRLRRQLAVLPTPLEPPRDDTNTRIFMAGILIWKQVVGEADFSNTTFSFAKDGLIQGAEFAFQVKSFGQETKILKIRAQDNFVSEIFGAEWATLTRCEKVQALLDLK